jgi:hypothetical protein
MRKYNITMVEKEKKSALRINVVAGWGQWE